MIELYSENQRTYTPYLFYTETLDQLHIHYKKKGTEIPEFSLMFTNYLDPMVVPLITQLGVYLKIHHEDALILLLSNTTETSNLLNFLEGIDFFKIVGDYDNPNWTKSRDLYNFSERYLGAYDIVVNQEIRKEHKLRVYDPTDNSISIILNEKSSDIDKRDRLLDYFSIIVDQDFGELFNDKESISDNKYIFNEIVAELLTNGIFHGKSTVSALMHTRKDKTSLSIADIGGGFTKSIKNKQQCFSNDKVFREKYEILRNDDFVSIFDTLLYSFQNNRRGLFDLIILVVCRSIGVFRIHNNSCQLILTSRYLGELEKLGELRELFYEEINSEVINDKIIEGLREETKDILSRMIEMTQKFYSDNYKFSTSRMFKVCFPGVHIEVEIVN